MSDIADNDNVDLLDLRAGIRVLRGGWRGRNIDRQRAINPFHYRVTGLIY
ncbi:MAG: hypothetical protein ABF290_07195 [Thiogranum sp.]